MPSKFTPAEGVTVTVQDRGDLAVLDVNDTGPDLADGEAAHVVDRVWQGPLAAAPAGRAFGGRSRPS